MNVDHRQAHTKVRGMNADHRQVHTQVRGMNTWLVFFVLRFYGNVVLFHYVVWHYCEWRLQWNLIASIIHSTC